MLPDEVTNFQWQPKFLRQQDKHVSVHFCSDPMKFSHDDKRSASVNLISLVHSKRMNVYDPVQQCVLCDSQDHIPEDFSDVFPFCEQCVGDLRTKYEEQVPWYEGPRRISFPHFLMACYKEKL